MNARISAALATILFLIVVLLGSPAISSVEAQGCSISNFTMSHSGQISLGTWVVLTGNSNCGTVRFTVNGEPRAETGQGNQTETFKTEEWGTGGFEICFVARGEGGWERADRRCQNLYVQGSQGAPPGSTNTGNVRCWVNNFSVTPSTIQQGNTVNFSGYGQCDGNARAARFYINGEPYGEYGGNTTHATWNTSNANPGNYNICFGITSGDWSQEARSCVTLVVVGQSAQPPTPASVQGPQSDNNQPGQTNQSGPNNTYQPTAVPQQNPPQQPQGNSGGGNSGGSSGGSGGNYNTGNCPMHRSQLSVGVIAIVTDYDQLPLRVRSTPEIANNVVDQLSVLSQVTVIGGPACNNNIVWWEIGYNGRSGWSAEVQGSYDPNLVPNGHRTNNRGSSNSGSSSGGSGNTGSSGSSGGSSNSGSSGSGSLTPPSTGGRAQTCPSVPARLVVGQQGRVIIDGRGATNVRRTPGGVLLTSMPEGTVFDVIDGPFCLQADSGNAIRWYGIRMSDGTTGWSPEASNSTYALEPWSGGSGNVAGAIRSTPRQSSYIAITFRYEPWNNNYTFVVDPQTCLVTNGSTVVANEISRFAAWLNNRNSVDRFVSSFSYLAEVFGQVENFRRTVEARLTERTGCSNLNYQVGDYHRMDMSGLGNIMYGYFEAAYPQAYGNFIANLAQAANPGSLFHYGDMPDDISQRALGRYIADYLGYSASVSPGLVENAATAVGLH